MWGNVSKKRVTMLQKSKLVSVVTILLLFLGTAISIALLISTFLNLFSGFHVGSFLITHHKEINPETQKNFEINWDDIVFDQLNEKNQSVPLNPNIFSPKLNVSKYTAATKCTNCTGVNATFYAPNRCFFLTEKTYRFSECFEACANISSCYYLINPGSWLFLIRGKIEQLKTYWVGVFKSNGMWKTLKGDQVPEVYDVFNSYCAYIGHYTDSPWSSFFCDTPRHCLCGGVKSITVGPLW
nr:homolog of EHV2 E7A envelope glycoprotein 42 [Macronycteris gammaherpesvirus 1]